MFVKAHRNSSQSICLYSWTTIHSPAIIETIERSSGFSRTKRRESGCTMTDFVLLAGKISDIPQAEEAPHAAGIEKRVVFAPGKFWNDYVARHFSVKGKNTQTQSHTHDWPHYMLILSGRCNATIDGTVYPLGKGCWAHIPPNVEHFMENTGEEPLEFICIVPPEGDPAGRAALA